MYLYSIKTIRLDRKCEEFVVSPNLELVLDYLELDIRDEGTEIECITRCVPIIKILKKPTE